MVNSDVNPIVSVVMATYNEPAEIISTSIESILKQTLTSIELIIIDDSTNKETIDRINRFAESDDRIVIIRNKERIGFVRALNIGLQQSKGRYIARMDGDDIAIINRLELQVKCFEQNSQYDVIGGNINIIDSTGNVVSYRSYPNSSLLIRFWTIFRSPVAHPTVMLKKDIVVKGYLYDEDFKKAEDLEFWLRLMNAGFRFYNLNQCLLNYRISNQFAVKRSNDQLRFNQKARIKNFSWRYPFLTSLSILISGIYTIIPQHLISKIYEIENKKLK